MLNWIMTKLLKSAPVYFLCKRTPKVVLTILYQGHIQRGKAGLSSSRFSKSLCLGTATEDVAVWEDIFVNLNTGNQWTNADVQLYTQ